MRLVVLPGDDDALQLHVSGERDVEQELLVSVGLDKLKCGRGRGHVG